MTNVKLKIGISKLPRSAATVAAVFWWLLALVCADAQSATVTTGSGSPGSYTFTVPAGVSSITVEAWGGGGRGARSNGGGGGGGAYARSVFSVSGGATYSYQVGAGTCSSCSGNGGASWFGSTSTLLAAGGATANSQSGSSGGSAGSSIGAVRYSGGSGASGANGFFGLGARGGGGGSSAGTGSNGGSASAATGGAAPAGGGAGGTGASSLFIVLGGAGEPGFFPGGGGGGGTSAFLSGGAGAGANGQVLITYEQALIHHIELSHSGSGITCQSSPVTVKACMDASCSALSSDPVTVTLSPSGWIGGDTFTFTGSTTRNLAITTAQTVTLGVTSSNPATSDPTLCRIGGGSASTSACGLQFYSSLLSMTVPTQVAGKDSGTIKLRAIATDPASSQCVPAFSNTTRTVYFERTLQSPTAAAATALASVRVNGTAVGSRTAISTAFDSNGEASLILNYPEAGSVTLDAEYLGSASTQDTGLQMNGSSTFTTTPAGFCIQSPDANAECSGTLSDCSVFKAAGDVFNLGIRAVAWETSGESGADFCAGNSTTRNFRFSNLPLSHSLIAPAGGNAGNAGVASVSFANSNGGDLIVSQTLSEVGVFRFSIAGGQSYLGATLPSAESANLGRFVPASFLLDVVDSGTLAPACTGSPGFTYIGQESGWSVLPTLQIRALNRSGNLTTNYTNGAFQKLAITDLGRTAPAADDVTTLSDGVTPAPVIVTDGVPSLSIVSPGILGWNFSLADSFRYDKTPAARVGPFQPALTFDLAAFSDSDGVSSQPSPPSVTPAAGFPQRYGRLRMINAQGPETVSQLSMGFVMEYWDGTRFVINRDDNCSAWTTADITYSGNHSTLSSASGIVASGTSTLSIQPNGSRGTDTAEWNLPVYLQDDWSGTGLINPTGLATLGVNRGDDRIIYWRER